MPTIDVHPSAKKFASAPGRLLIGGRWVDAAAGERFPTIDPSTADVITEIAAGNREDVDRAVAAARSAFENGPWPRMTADDRGKLLWALADLLERNSAEFAHLEALDNGKSVGMASFMDVPAAVQAFRYYAGLATKIQGNTMNLSVPYTPGARFLAYTLKQPIGVVGAIVPWNFPLMLTAWKLGPALAAGNTVVLKPAEQTSLSALRLGALIQEAGFPDGVVNIVTGLGETAGAALTAHPGVDKITFTGSTEVGKLIVKAAAGNLKRVSLELGGKSPSIIFEDADIDTAIAGAAQHIFFNHGQSCVAGSRLYVQRAAFDRVVDGVAAAAKDIKLGGAFDSEAQMGPIVSDEQLRRITSYIDSGVEEGATVVAGGRKRDGAGYFVEPTVMTNVHGRMKICREEIFGPVLACQPFDDVDELIKLSNDSEYGLACAVWTRDLNTANKVSQLVHAGSVYVNCHSIVDPAMPFGGFKQSGWGREHGPGAIDMYTETKAVCTLLA
jgi:phenylacetaldehyde dehydrogenase